LGQKLFQEHDLEIACEETAKGRAGRGHENVFAAYYNNVD